MIKSRPSVTLIELVIVITITSVVVLGLGSYIKQAVDTWNYMSYRSEIVNEVRMGVMRMGRDIRQMQANGINATSNSSQLLFLAGSGNYIRYRYYSGSLFYEESSSVLGPFTAYPLMDNLVNANVFDYFDANMNSTVNVNAIRFVRVKPRLAYRGQVLNLDYDIAPRNLESQ